MLFGLDAPAAWGAIALGLLAVQLPAAALLLSRLARGPRRIPPLTPAQAIPDWLGSVSVLVPTLNEAQRLGPCLEGLARQGHPLREVLVVDSHSQDGTPDLVAAVAARDPRFRLLQDDPLPAGWVGRPWALHYGFGRTSPASRWILGIDADVRPQPGLVAALLAAAEAGGWEVVSLAPRFQLKFPGEIWLQPALLMTLVYRFGPAGGGADGPERVMANGQCFLCRRDRLAALGGYASAGQSFCDDVTLARNAAASGAKVAFLDGSRLLEVRMYEGAAETWREWGRSLDLKDAASRAQVWSDFAFLLAVQALPLPATLGLGGAIAAGAGAPTLWAAFALNAALALARIALTFAIAGSYNLTDARAPWLFWLSPLADPLAVLRIGLSSGRTPTQWRGRQYGAATATP